ncbi:hypothetical protein M1247_12120 [Mycobacterium sp. 21AC1]|uniref:hypothetical protein n=1 Tax=[Mycobacterium] appelbergii TaxID=2939269 RepID=UPI0029393167|nr:hypothetical protein [Mycobacterium sp. 21AC1]MDV3125663.1 hypothetical protein [Mycobacterium sp. 21AC1]
MTCAAELRDDWAGPSAVFQVWASRVPCVVVAALVEVATGLDLGGVIDSWWDAASGASPGLA